MVLAYSYLRFSSPEQAKGDSFRRQTDASSAYCLRRGWTMDSSLTLSDKGISAFRGKNAETGALGAFVGAVSSGRITKGSVLIIESIDRLSRNSLMEAQDLFRDLLRMGIVVITLVPEREYSWDGINENPFLLLELTLYMIRANEESATKSKRVRESWDARRSKIKEKPITLKCPAWIKPKEGRFVVMPERAAVIKRIFELCIGGMGAFNIAKKLNGEGVPPFTKTPWHLVYVNKILRNRACIGEFQPQSRTGAVRKNIGQAVPGYYPTVVSDEIFYRAQAAVTSRQGVKGRKGTDVANLFTGLIYDARDGCKMMARAVGKGVRMLTSQGVMKGQVVGDDILTFSYSIFEAAFLRLVSELTLDQPESTSRQAKIDAEEALLRDVTNRIERIKAQLLTDDSLEMLIDVLRQLETSRKAATERLERFRNEDDQDQHRNIQDAQDAITQLADAEDKGGEELGILRERLKNKIHDIVESIWMLVGTDGRFHRRATIQVFFKNGTQRFIQIESRKFGRHSKLEIMTNKTPGVAPVPIDLRHYRTGNFVVKKTGKI